MAQGDYEVLNGFAQVDVDDPDVWGLGQISEGEAFGMYLPEEPEPGLSDVDDCGGRGMSALDGGLVQMIQGISGFGDLGYSETLAYGSLGDQREGYPLGADVGPMDADGYQPSYDEGAYVDDYPAPPPDNSDIPPAKTVDQAELAEILEQRRQAIADAVKQRNLMTQKVSDLDHQIVQVLNPQYQQALAMGDQEKAVTLGGQIRILNLQRAEAVQKALDWAQFQATASQMAKNVKAQLALNQLYQETLLRQDPQAAAEIAQAYAEIGAATGAIKLARQQQLQYQQEQQQYTTAQQQYAQQQQQQQAQALQQQAVVEKARTMLATEKAYLTKLLREFDVATKKYAALKASKGIKIIPKTLSDQIMRLRLQIESSRAKLTQVQQAQQQAAAQVPLSTQQPYGQPYGQPAPYGQAQGYGYDPYAQQQQYGFQGVDEIDDLGALDATTPYCTLYTRDGYGPTCMEQAPMNLGDLAFDWDMFTRVSTDVVSGGAAELAWNKNARDGLDKKVDKVGKVSSFIAKNVTCPIAKNVKQSAIDGKATSGSMVGAFASSALVGLCDTKGTKAMPVLVVREDPLWRRWWFLPVCLAVGGASYGIYRAVQSPQAMQGLSGLRRRRRRHRR